MWSWALWRTLSRVLAVLPNALFTIADRISDQASSMSVVALRRCLADLQRSWAGTAGARAAAALSDLIDRIAAHDLRVLKHEAGRLIVSFGDPASAPCIATYIPGAGTTDVTANDELDRAHTLRAAAGADTCVVMWLDYDTPTLLQASGESHARAAAPALRQFQADLVSNHDGPIRQLTVIGHSYGSTVIGVAERDGTLLADDLVALGSPGMGVSHLDKLRPSAQIWHATAANDPIRLVPGHLRGGTPFASASFGHSGYFRPDNPALATLAAIASGTCPRLP